MWELGSRGATYFLLRGLKEETGKSFSRNQEWEALGLGPTGLRAPVSGPRMQVLSASLQDGT